MSVFVQGFFFMACKPLNAFECQVTHGLSVSIDKLGHNHFSIAYSFPYNISDFSHMYT